MGPLFKKKRKKSNQEGKSFFWMEGHKLNEQTGKLEPVKFKVWY